MLLSPPVSCQIVKTCFEGGRAQRGSMIEVTVFLHLVNSPYPCENEEQRGANGEANVRFLPFCVKYLTVV